MSEYFRMDEVKRLLEELTSGEDRRAEAAVHMLHAIGKPALPALKETLEDPKEDVRWWATWAAAGIQDPEVPVLLVERLQDVSLEVRQCAALGLRQQPDPGAIPYLVQAAQGKDPTTTHLAAAALAAIGKPAVPALTEALKTSSRSVQIELLRTLAAIGDPESIPALFEVLGSDSVLMEHWANEGLDRMGVGMSYFKT